MPGDQEKLHWAIDKGLRDIFPGVKKVIVSTGGEYYPESDRIPGMMEIISPLKVSELLLEAESEHIFIVKHDYGDDLAAVYYEPGIAPADISRLIRLMFAGRCRREYSAFVPMATVESTVKCWEKRVAIVFGREFARRLVQRSLKGKNTSTLTHDDLEGSRAFIASAIGDCLFLQKVHK